MKADLEVGVSEERSERQILKKKTIQMAPRCGVLNRSRGGNGAGQGGETKEIVLNQLGFGLGLLFYPSLWNLFNITHDSVYKI